MGNERSAALLSPPFIENMSPERSPFPRWTGAAGFSGFSLTGFGEGAEELGAVPSVDFVDSFTISIAVVVEVTRDVCLS